MRHYRGWIILLISIFFLSGCWDRKEINDLAFITTTGIDKLGENEFRVSLQIPLPSAMSSASGGGGGTSGDKPYYVDSEIGRNIGEVYARLQQRMSREIFIAHRRVFVIGEKTAKGGMKQTLDAVFEQPASRLSTLLVVAKGDALDILTSSPHLEQFPSEAIREISKNSINVDVRNALDDIYKPGKDPVIPVVSSVKTENMGKDERQEVQMSNVAIFDDSKLKFITNRSETSGITWLLRKMKNKSINIPVKDDLEVDLRVLDYKIKTRYKVKNNLPEFTIKLHVSTALLQNEPKVQLEDIKQYKMLVEKMENEIKKQIDAVFNHAKSEGVDPFGLGYHVFQRDNELWEEHLEQRWRELLKDVKVSVDVFGEIEKINIRTIKIQED